jgi:4'-phosphopantetheinyl transferase
MTPAEVRVVWRATSALTTADLDAALATLSDDEREQHGRFRFPEDARDYAAAHELLRTALSAWPESVGSRQSDLCSRPSDWRFVRDARGKPALAGGSGPLPSFSLTHTSGMVACAIAPPGVAVGVDVEPSDRNVDTLRLASRVFAPSEIAALAALDDRTRRMRFFDLWTLKEAVVKALGLAVPASLPSVAFEIAEGGREGEIRYTGPLAGGAPWTFALFSPAPGYRLAVAASGALTISVAPRCPAGLG